MIKFEPIGIIHTPHKNLEGMPIQPVGADGVAGTIEIFPKFQAGLKDLDGFSHIILLYHFHQNHDYTLQIVPFMDTEERGLFATRAPKRPNPIGLSVVKLNRVKGGILHVQNVDMLNGTPLIDIKPYVPNFDEQTAVKTGWLEEAQKRAKTQKSDKRFIS